MPEQFTEKLTSQAKTLPRKRSEPHLCSSGRCPALAKEMLQSNSRPVIVATVFHSGFEGV
jgi:hypothetical protein